jgi:hypothetical protein
MGLTKPADGVMPTRPLIAPVIAPVAVGLPWMLSSVTQVRNAAAAAILVLQKASAAMAFAARADPPLKPWDTPARDE